VIIKRESWVSLEEWRSTWGVSKDTVHRWLRNRRLPTHKVGHLWKFQVSEVDEWVRELVYTADDMEPLAEVLRASDSPLATMVPQAPYRWDDARRVQLRAELDAWFARAYGLTRDELRYILDPADVHGPDFPSETFRVLKEKEQRQFGEYRTRRLVLEAWDRLVDAAVGEPGMSAQRR